MNKTNSTYLYDIGGRKSVKWVIKRINEKINHSNKNFIKILDIGCGTCQLTKILSEKFNCEVLAIDIDDKSISMARKNIKNKNVVFKLLDVESECIDGKFDVILMTQVIDHLKNPSQVLDRLSKINLESNGSLIIGVSNGYGLYERSKKKHKFDVSYLKNEHGKNLIKIPYTCNTNSPHLWKYNKNLLVNILDKSNLKIVNFKNIAFALPAFPFNRLYFSMPIFISKILDTIDGIIADCIPSSIASNWYIECKIK